MKEKGTGRRQIIALERVKNTTKNIRDRWTINTLFIPVLNEPYLSKIRALKFHYTELSNY
jgi:hypothetical protein